MQTCNAKTRNGTPCKSKAMANGRCRMHGGASLSGAEHPNYRHGRYSTYLPASIEEKMQAVSESDPLDLLPELHVQRALFAQHINSFEGKTITAFDIGFLMSWSAEIGRMVERIVKMRNDTALTAAEVALIAARIPDVVTRYIHDPIQQQQFVADLFSAVGASATANTSQPRISANN